MKALIVGACGQLGRQLVARCPVGWACIAKGRADLDVTDRTAVRLAALNLKPDLVFNAAAYTDVDRAEVEQDLAFAINTLAVQNLADAVAASQSHLVQISSDYVFDGRSSHAYRPSDEPNPLSVYGRSKAAGEDAAGALATVVRTSWVYTAGADNFVSTLLRLMQQRDEVRVVDDQIAAPTWANGLADTLWSLGIAKATGLWHYSDAGVASWFDFAVAIAEDALEKGICSRAVTVTPIKTADNPNRARRPAFSLLDSSATRTMLGIPAVHWRANLSKMLNDHAATR